MERIGALYVCSKSQDMVNNPPKKEGHNKMKCLISVFNQDGKIVWVCNSEVGSPVKNNVSRDRCWKYNCKGRRHIPQKEIDLLTVDRPTECLSRECSNKLPSNRKKFCSTECRIVENRARHRDKNKIKPRKRHRYCNNIKCREEIPKDRFKYCSFECERLENARRKRQKREDLKRNKGE